MTIHVDRLLSRLMLPVLFLTLSWSLQVVFAANAPSVVQLYASQGEISPGLQGIMSRGKLIVAMCSSEAPPFVMQDEARRLTGIDVDIARDIGEKLGVDVIFDRSAKTYDQVVGLVFAGKVDVGISSLSDTLQRALLVSFTRPYWALRQALLINRLKLSALKNGRDTDDVSLVLNQNGIRIGVVSGSSYVDFAAKDYPKAETVLYDNLKEGIDDTKSGKIIAFLYDEAEIINWNNRHPEDSLFLKTTFIKDSKDTLAFAVGWRNEQLLHWLNLYIEKSKPSFLKQLKQKYMKTE